ncbi:TDT family transporter [Labrys wisconsinensis]|uniref:C4-dicarboxylate transporter/malic acid transport protein n=1 Tax=Labrys wisconsinensis TaxID=425677 RepID=A0ABU0J9D6_9HYPH|nr:TDT family transporter [Labrys wisconsinensis]MDQ0470220.1 C4-dicarboxylate transporter/malic acid transport protein [Labrys wisconsinensis]
MSETVMPTQAIANSARLSGRLEIVRQFTPNWFTVTMGTGILALALNQAPINIPGLRAVADALWLLNIGLFTAFTCLYVTRWILFSSEAMRVFGHSVVSMFFGAIPMGLATIINGFLAFGIQRWGETAVSIAQALWWLDATLSVACGVLIPFLMFTRQDHSVEKMTAVWLLPIVAAEVAASSAGLLVPHLTGAAALHMLILGYALWAFSVPLAMSVLVILVLRLVLHKLPHRDMAASGWLALGPIGTGSLGLLLLGADAPAVFAQAGMPAIGDVAHGIGIIGGAVMWGYGAWWLLLAVLTTIRYIREGMPFNIGWWGFTFPLGVYAVATLTLARQTQIGFLAATGGVLVGCLALFWLIIAARTLRGACNRSLFVSPCLITGSIPSDFEADAV